MKANELMRYKNWVVVGDVLNNTKYAYKILKELKASGYNVVGINPRGNREDCFVSLQEVKYHIDVVDLCINPIDGIKIVKELKKYNIDKILIQPGAQSPEILEYCENNDIIKVQGCALVEL